MTATHGLHTVEELKRELERTAGLLEQVSPTSEIDWACTVRCTRQAGERERHSQEAREALWQEVQDLRHTNAAQVTKRGAAPTERNLRSYWLCGSSSTRRRSCV